MKALTLLAVVLTFGLTTISINDAEAARLGGGKSSGMQRSAPPAAAARAPSAAPAAPAPAAQPGRSWMGPLAGLAAGIGLAALASHFGFGAELGNMMMIGLLIVAVMAVIGFIMRRRAGSQPAANGLQYATSAPQDVQPAKPYDLSMAAPGSAAAVTAAPASALNAAAPSIPADFDVAGFVRNAKVNYIRLQAANDAGNLDDIREFTTPEMFAEIKMDIDARKGAKQTTDVVSINADVLEVAEEPNRYIVSTRFTGVIREDGNNGSPVDEIWHLIKPRDGKTGWVLAGIQQSQ